MSLPSAMQPQRPVPGAIKVVFYGPSRERAQRMADRLQEGADLSWEDSRGTSVAAIASRHATWRVLLLDFANDQLAAATELAGQLAALAPELPLVAVGDGGGEQGAAVLAAMRAGARDFVGAEAPADEILGALHRANATSQSAPAKPTLATVPRRNARVILLLGARAGLGVSTLAAHLGALAQAQSAPAASSDPQTLLLDLGQPAGDAALYLSTNSDFHVEDAIRHAGRIDATLVRTAMSQHGSGLTILSQPSGTPHAAAAVDVEQLLDRLRGIFGVVLCDLGGIAPRQVPAALLRQADETWLVTDQSIGALVSLDQLLQQLERDSLRDGRLRLIVNRYHEDGGIAPRQIAAHFSLPLIATLPERLRTLRACASHGALLQQEHPRDPYLRALVPLLARLADGAAGALPPRSFWRSLATRIGPTRWKTR